MRIKKWVALSLVCLSLSPALAKDRASRLPLLVIGGSYAEGKTPFDNGLAPLGGVSVGFGSYLSLGQALTRTDDLPGFVIDEGQAGAGTFARPWCAPGATSCGPAGWAGYDTQLQRALARVAMPPTFMQYNAAYVVITSSNDCLHADAFGVPQAQAQPCTPAQMNQTVDRMIAVGRQALAAGITPVYDVLPRYERLDLPLFRSLFGLAWVIGESDYNQLRDLSAGRIRAELPQAVVLDIWRDFVHLGDGIHPNPDTARKAARVIANELHRRDGGAH
ncbi:MAG TPA: SGNH/GDSL hydrolase family protein [Albitalea sp.]|uniref:SGNH/GDSL hydrolase family protein n=1 Tax=Piscinibacter sp. TaxID=1903157 RepID=UPI002ED64F99